MRRLLSLSILLSLLSLQSIAQDIPNADMETWIKYGTYEEPQYWTTPNQETSALMVFSVNKETSDVYSGDYAARLESISILGGMAVVPGFMTIGDFDVNTTTMEYKTYGGIPFTKRPLRLKGYNKYWPQDADKWFIAISLFKYDTVNMTQDTVGIGFYESGDTNDLWTPFEIFINYWSQDDPDSMNIIILTTRNETPAAGSILLIDSLWLDYTPSSVAEVAEESQFEMYPNPATKQIYIRSDQNKESIITITNLWGEEVYYQKIKNEETLIDLSHLASGVYIVQCFANESYSQKKLILR